MADEPSSPQRLYDEFASWWRLLSDPAEYEEEAEFYWTTLRDGGDRPPRTVLELGSGGGNNASFMKRHAEMSLVDLSPGMLEQSRALNPECEHFLGDMRSVRLDREFDRLFVHDALCYMTSEADLRAMMETAFVHCAPGGAALFAPDYVRETFVEGTECGGNDDGSRGMRYLEWTHDPDPADCIYTVDYAYLLREEDGSARAEHDRHVEGLFPRATWLRLLADVGFEARIVPFRHSEVPTELEIFVGRRPIRG